MSRYGRPIPADLSARERAIEEARAAGRIGFPRVPDEALFADGRDPSDTAIHALLQAFDAGQLERGRK